MICGTTAIGAMPVRTPLYIKFSVSSSHTIQVGNEVLTSSKDFDQHLAAFKKALIKEVKAYQKKHNQLPKDIRGTFHESHLMGTRGMYRDVVIAVKKELGIQ
ncbi:hypothetical protein BKI52_17910 [marine bacterium AO1-C]|nr:hypothetical protein BKI52_17910 [marine bacterium AO1-C]